MLMHVMISANLTHAADNAILAGMVGAEATRAADLIASTSNIGEAQIANSVAEFGFNGILADLREIDLSDKRLIIVIDETHHDETIRSVLNALAVLDMESFEQIVSGMTALVA